MLKNSSDAERIKLFQKGLFKDEPSLRGYEYVNNKI
jgi:hypothetical protein